MIKVLKALFEPNPAVSAAELEHRLHLVAAAMLVETARADFAQGLEEQATMQQLLCTTLGLGRDEVADLIEAAGREVDDSTSLYEFTRVINDHFSAQQKLALIGDMWKVAYADGNLDKYEEHLIRRVAELIYVPHSDYIRVKLAAGGATA